MSKRIKKFPFAAISGEVMKANYDNKINELNVELGTSYGAPVLRFLEFQKKEKIKVFFTLHLGEALRLKAIIDRLLLDYVMVLNEETREAKNEA